MGRNRESGLNYYPFDIDFFADIKIRKLIKYQGGKAVTVYALLLCLIYKSGYYMRWDDELPFICSEQTGFDEAYISEVIKSCLALGLFDSALFNSDSILTSRGIQERYANILKLCKRKATITDYNLIHSEQNGISSELIPDSSEQMAISPEFMPQSKVKRSKENISVVGVNAHAPACEGDPTSYDWLLSEFFKPEHAGVVEQLCMGMKIEPNAMQEYANEVVSDWAQKNIRYTDYTEASTHLINHIRRKVNARRGDSMSPIRTIAERKKAFKAEITHVMCEAKAPDGSQLYTPEICRDFFRYWTELTQDKSRMRFEAQEFWETDKRMEKWLKRIPAP